MKRIEAHTYIHSVCSTDIHRTMQYNLYHLGQCCNNDILPTAQDSRLTQQSSIQIVPMNEHEGCAAKLKCDAVSTGCVVKYSVYLCMYVACDTHAQNMPPLCVLPNQFNLVGLTTNVILKVWHVRTISNNCIQHAPGVSVDDVFLVGYSDSHDAFGQTPTWTSESPVSSKGICDKKERTKRIWTLQ